MSNANYVLEGKYKGKKVDGSWVNVSFTESHPMSKHTISSYTVIGTLNMESF